MILAFAGQKGGAGKSTTAIAVACELVHRGRRVLLVDADPQATAVTWASIASEGPKPTTIAMGVGLHREDQLPRIAAGFDDVVIDCPPKQGAIQRSALVACDVAVLPCGPSAADGWALASSVELVTETQSIRPNLQGVVLVTRKQQSTTLGRTARRAFEECGLPVLDVELGARVAYVEALAAGLGVTTYAPKSAAALEVRRLVTELQRLTEKAAHAHVA